MVIATAGCQRADPRSFTALTQPWCSQFSSLLRALHRGFIPAFGLDSSLRHFLLSASLCSLIIPSRQQGQLARTWESWTVHMAHTDHGTGGARSPKPSLVAPQPQLRFLSLCQHHCSCTAHRASRTMSWGWTPLPGSPSLSQCKGTRYEFAECLPQERALSLLQLSQHTQGLGPALKANRHLEKVKQGQRNKFSTTKTCSRSSFLFYHKRKKTNQKTKRVAKKACHIWCLCSQYVFPWEVLFSHTYSMSTGIKITLPQWRIHSRRNDLWVLTESQGFLFAPIWNHHQPDASQTPAKTISNSISSPKPEYRDCSERRTSL